MFIVIEGIDGAGCETQAKLVANSLTRKLVNSKIELIKFPHYDTPVGNMIKDFLYLNQKMKAHEQFLLYTLQFIFDENEIKEKAGISIMSQATNKPINQSSVLIADRYFTTTLCYQTLEGFDEKTALRYADDFGIIKPDMVFFLDVKPETALQWKQSEQKEKNFREKDVEFIKRTYDKYIDLVERQVWTRWIRINGEQSKEKVAQDILKYLL